LVRNGTADLARIFVLAQTLINHLAKQVIVRPGQIFHLNHKLRLNPMHAAEDERRTKAAGPRRRHIERHLGGGERLQAAPQSLQLGIVDPDPGATGIHQSAVRCVIRQQERLPIRADAAKFPVEYACCSGSADRATAMGGYLCVQSRPVRVNSWALPWSRRACMR
jgi:hypothetical protein